MSAPHPAEASVGHSRPWITAEDQHAVAEALAAGTLAEWRLASRFERAVAEYHDLPGAVATSSGTAALALTLRAMYVGPGAEVVIPTYVCRSVWDAVCDTGAVPVLCDVGEDWCMTPETVAPRLTPRTRAVVVVHTFGIVADVAEIAALGVPVVEDCCQAFGARRGSVLAGTVGDAVVFSFHATKLLTSGEGGMAAARDPGLVERIRSAKVGGGGLAERRRHPLSDLQAALGLSQLARYEDFLRRRWRIAERYCAEIDAPGAELPRALRGRSNFFRFPLRVRGDFDAHRARFSAEGVEVRRGVDALLHRELGLDRSGFPGAERCYATTLSIPIYPALAADEVERVIRAANLVLRDAAVD